MLPVPSPVPAARRAARRALKTLAAAALVVLAGCGGGTSQYEPFVPERVFAFGDETTALTADGHNYSINGLDDTTKTFNCALQPNWVQSLASVYGYVFAECPDATKLANAHNLAAAGARVADVSAQVDARVAAGGFTANDLVAMMVGVNDVADLYALYDGTNEATLIEQARQRGIQTGQIVNRLIALGPRVVIANIPDLGTTPLAVKEEAAFPGAGRPALLSRLSQAFNERLGVTILIDGRYVALVQTDQRVLAMFRSPGSFLLSNVTDAVCTTPPPACTTATLVADASSSTHLWASDLLLSTRGQNELATLAINRAQRNPF